MANTYFERARAEQMRREQEKRRALVANSTPESASDVMDEDAVMDDLDELQNKPVSNSAPYEDPYDGFNFGEVEQQSFAGAYDSSDVALDSEPMFAHDDNNGVPKKAEKSEEPRKVPKVDDGKRNMDMRKHRNVSSKNSAPRGDVVQIRNFPTSVINYLRAEIPSAGSYADALSAYVIAKSGNPVKDFGVKEDIEDLAKTYQKNKTVDTVDKKIADMEKQLKVLTQIARETELALSYLLYDRLGFTKEHSNIARNVNFMEEGIMDLVDRLREQSHQISNQDKLRHGRAIR